MRGREGKGERSKEEKVCASLDSIINTVSYDIVVQVAKTLAPPKALKSTLLTDSAFNLIKNGTLRQSPIRQKLHGKSNRKSPRKEKKCDKEEVPSLSTDADITRSQCKSKCDYFRCL